MLNLRMKDRLQRIGKLLSEKSAHALVVTNPITLTYTMGFKTEADTYLLVPSNDLGMKPTIFAPELEYALIRSKVDSSIFDIKKLISGLDLLQMVCKSLEGLSNPRVAIEFDYISHKLFGQLNEFLRTQFSTYEILDFSAELKGFREIKAADELENIRKASEIGMKGFLAVQNEIRAGMSEHELAAIAEYAMKKAGSQHPSFNTLIQTGPNSAYPHGSTTDRKVQPGDFVLVDLGATYNGYCSDLTRTFVFGSPKSDKQKEMMKAVNESNRICREAVKEGAIWGDLYLLSKNILADHGLDQYYNHGLGHGVGIEIHESPWLNAKHQKPEHILKEGMVITIEPGAYIEGLGGVRTEDLLIVRKDGYVNLSPLPYFE